MKSSFTLFIFLSCFSQIAFAQQSLLDPSFGNHGIVKTDMGSGFNYANIGKQVLLQSDGSIYLAFDGNVTGFGISSPTTVAKLHSDGSPDVSYGNNGFSEPVPIFSTHAAMQADGKIIIAGSVNSTFQPDYETDFAVARLNTDGSLDKTFGENGIQITRPGKYAQGITSIAIQNDGKIVGAGYDVATAPITIVLIRYEPDGNLDPTFGANGISATVYGTPRSVAIGEDGKIVVGGYVHGNPSIVRYNEDGSVDATFNGTGIQTLDFDGYVQSVAVQTDGRIVAAGIKGNGKNSDYAVARLNADGSPDVTFSGDGFQTTDFAGGNDSSTSVILQSNGKIVLAGYSSLGNTTNFAICRYNTDGSLDNTFNINGKQTTNFGSDNGYANSIAIQADGKLVAMGYKDDGVKSEVVAARYAADGSPDNSFGESGIFSSHIEQGDTHFTSTAIQDDGRIVAAGYTWNGSNYDFALTRYNTNGTLDNTFATEGKEITDFGNTNDTARAIVIQKDGKFLVSGSVSANFVIARYNANGSLDPTFGVNGILITDFSTADYFKPIILQNDGKILVGGTSLARYYANGSPDLSFGEQGKISLQYVCSDIAIQSDGKIVIVGSDYPVSNTSLQLWVARYNIDGVADQSFGTVAIPNYAYGNNGTIVFMTDGESPGADRLIAKSVKFSNDGKIVIGGYREHDYRISSSSFLLLRLGSDGTPDNTFGNNGMLITGAGSRLNYSTSMVIDNDNKMTMAGYSYNGSNYNFTMMRFNADGSLDNTFGGNGIQITDASSANNRIEALALSDDNLYAVGYGQFPGNLGLVAKYLIPSGGPLPVTLTDFTASLKNNSVLLQWQTASEHNLSHFTIERSADESNFNSINSVNAFGSSDTKINYSTVDNQPLHGYNYYRLKLVDIDGKFKYSKIVAVNNRSVFTFQINPNPASNMLFLKINSNGERTNYEIIDVMGRKLKEGAINLSEYGLYPIDISSLSKGTYIINLQTKTKKESGRFIKN